MSFKDADDEWISQTTGIETKHRLWKGYPQEDVEPSSRFRQNFLDIGDSFHMTNEAGRRVFLNLFLTDIICRPEFKKSLRVFPEIRMQVIGTHGNKRRKLVGDTDYTIGFAKRSDGEPLDIFGKTAPKELHLLAIEAKCAWDKSDYWQCVAETATLHKIRKDSLKNSEVWGVLSNATDWQFIYIDIESKLWTSKKLLLSIPLYDEGEIRAVYRFLHAMVKRCFEACTPTNTPSGSSDNLEV